MYKLIRSILFKFDPEKMHYFTSGMLNKVLKFPFMKAVWNALFQINHPSLEKELFGLKFKNPVGLAAGFDKNASMFNDLAYCGFGFIEIGTVTPKGQPGNEKPRLFRLIEDEGIINRMGFNNEGVESVIKNLKNSKRQVIIGGNIGKNTATSPDLYTEDYCDVFKSLHPYVDYFVLNVSCPNVGSHAKLGDKDYLLELISAVQLLNEKENNPKPILLKIAPDLNHIQLDEIIEIVQTTNIDGVIATNTSVSREGLKKSKDQLMTIGNGGLSGKPIKDMSTETIKYLAQKSNKAFPIIGVGGIHSSADAIEKIEAGADLIQLYTGFIYEGPALVSKINKELIKYYKKN